MATTTTTGYDKKIDNTSLQIFFETIVGFDHTTSTSYANALYQLHPNIEPLQISQSILENAHIGTPKMHQILILRAIEQQQQLQNNNNKNNEITSTTITAKKVAPRLNIINDPTLLWETSKKNHLQTQTIKNIKRIYMIEKSNLLIANDADSIHIWNMMDQTNYQVIRYEARQITSLTRLVVSSNGLRIITSDDQGIITFWSWDPQSSSLKMDSPRVTWTEDIWSIVFTSPCDETHIVVGGGKGSLALIDIMTGDIVRTQTIQQTPVLSLAAHPSYEFVLAGSGIESPTRKKEPNGMRLIKLSDFSVLYNFGGHVCYVREVGWINDKICLSAGDDGKILSFSMDQSLVVDNNNNKPSCQLITELAIQDNIWSMAKTFELPMIAFGVKCAEIGGARIYFIHAYDDGKLEVIRVFHTHIHGTYISAMNLCFNCANEPYHRLVVAGSDGYVVMYSLEMG
jgi:WD40 repeat protein